MANLLINTTVGGNAVITTSNIGSYALTSITSGQVTTALGYTPYNATNPSGYISSITSGNVTTALGYTPYNATNPSGYITSSGSISGNATTATTAARATRANGNFYIDDNYGNTVVGVYASTRYQGVFAMGDSYKLPADGTSTGNLYGLAWSHPNAGGVASNLNDHGLLVINNGVFAAAISSSIRAAADMRAPIFYDSQNAAYYLDPNSTSNLNIVNLSTLNSNTLNTSDVNARYFSQSTNGVPSNNLGSPTVTEMALFDEQFNNKTAFYNPASLSFWTSSDGTNYTEYTGFDTTIKKRFLGGDSDSGVYIPNLTNRFRIEVENSAGYVFLNQLYIYWSSNSHSTKVHIWVRRCDNNQWYQWTDSNVQVSSWPGHLYLPFGGIPFYPGYLDSTGHYNRIRIEFIPTWAGGTYSYTGINLMRMQIWGGYPAGKRNIYSTDENQNVSFPAIISATTFSGALSGNATTASALTSMNISQFTNNSGYITGYTETDTLNSITNRGNTTSNSVRFGSYLDISPTTSAFRFYDGTTFRGGFGLDSWGHYGSDANLVLYVNGDNTLFFSTSGTKRASLSSSAFNSLVALQQSGNQVLHAGNYTSYSPTLTGGGASGTWGINVTGSSGSATTAGSLTSMNISQFTNNSGYITGYTETDTLASVTGRGATTSTPITVTASEGREVAVYMASSYTTDDLVSGHEYGWYSDHWRLGMTRSGGAQGADFVIQWNGARRLSLTNGGNLTVTGTISGTNFSGSSSGTNTGDQTNISGNAATATALTSMNISQFTNNSGYLTSVTNISGNAGTVTHNASRTDGTLYNIGWFAGANSPAYSCNAVQIRSSDGTVFATSYRGSGNVGGTGEAIHAPAGVYSTGTNWLYGTMYVNGNSINDAGYFGIIGTNTTPINITGASHKYITINPGNGYEAMVRYIGGSGYSWYVGKRVSTQLVGTESFHFYSEQAGATVAGIDTSGNIHATGSMRAPIFYDSNNTDYYGDFASESRLNTFTTAGSVVIGGTFANNAYNAVASTRLMFGGGTEPNSYSIGTNMENIGGNYTKLDIRWHTGIRMGAQPGYGGIRFYDTEALGTVIFSIGNGDSHVRVVNNLYVGGNLALHAGNYNSYSPTLTGTGASGSWGISVTGSAGSVAWTNVSSRPTALSQFTNDLGNYGGFLTSITAHTHAISDVTGLQTALDGKQASLGFTPYNSTNPSGYITSSGSISGNAATATNVAYSGLTGTVPTWNQNTTGNAATVGGYGVSAGVGANTVVIREGNGYAFFNYINSNVSETENPTINSFYTSNGDGYFRKSSVAHVKSQLGLGSLAYSSASIPTNNNQLTNGAGYITGINSGNVTTALGFTPYNATNPSGYISSYSETDTLATVTGRGATFSSNITSSNGAWIKFSSAAETDTNDGKIGSGVFASGLNIVGAQTSAGLGRQIRLWGSVITSDGYTFYHSGNIPTWNQNTTGSAATATSATSATQLSTYGTITSDNWNTYFVSGQLIASSVSAHSGSNRPSNHYDYGAALSYGVSGGALWQMYFPENGGNSAGSYRNMAYRTGWNGTWGDWRSPVNQIGQVATVAGSNGTGVEIHSNVGYNQDPLTYFLMRGQADSSWKSFKIRLTGDAGGQDIEFRRIAENSADARIFYVPRGANQVIFDYTVVTPSDSRLKDNLTLITTPVEKIKSLRGVEFDWNSGEHVGTHDVGLIAQDVEAVLPEAVTTQEDGYKNLAYTKVIPLLVEAMKEQQTMIEALRAEIELLKNR